jgi:hypothetical protein
MIWQTKASASLDIAPAIDEDLTATLTGLWKD